MSLSQEVEYVNNCPVSVKPETKDKALQEVIEEYRQTLRKHSNYQGLTKEYRTCANKTLTLIDRILEGKTTFQQEIEKLHPYHGLPNELFLLFEGDFDIPPKAKMLDDVIQRIYLKEK